jgi:succinoglycan biosynthesis protein ExoA
MTSVTQQDIMQDISQIRITSPEPYVSVVLPVRNEETFIARCLTAVLSQDYPPEKVEVLIADGMSEDRTVEIVQSLPGAERVQIIANPHRLQAIGLNTVIPRTHGEVIVRVDGHTIIESDYISQCVNALWVTGAQNTGGRMDPVGITPMGKAIAIAGKSPFAVPTAFHVSTKAQFTDTVYMGAWPRQVFNEIGLYAPDLIANEDYELNYRIRQAGGYIYFTPLIRSRYYNRQSLCELAQQYFTYGKWKVEMLRRHPRSLRVRHLAAPAFVAAIAGGLLLLPFRHLSWLGFFIAALYLAANLIASLHAAIRSDWRFILRLPVVFFVIHMAWGSGFWAGIFSRRQ